MKASSDSDGMRLIFPPGHGSIIKAPPGEGKQELLVRAAMDYLKSGMSVVYITTERPPVEIKKIFSRYNYDIKALEGNKFLFIDIFSYSVKQKYEKGLNIDNPANLNMISINLEKARRKIGSPVVVIFDSISTLFIHVDEQEVIKFMGTFISKIKTNNEILLATIQEGMHEKKTYTSLEHMADSLIVMGRGEGRDLREVRFAFSRDLELPDVFHFNINSGELFSKRKKEKIRLPILPIAGLLLIAVIGVVSIWYFMNPGSSEIIPEKIEKEEIMDIETGDGWVKTFILNPEGATGRGILMVDTPYYNISINLDRSHFLIFDKINSRPITIFNDEVDNPIDMLTGCDIGYADVEGNNKIPFSTTALHDDDGLVYELVDENKEEGYIMLSTRGWDVSPTKLDKGYDVEAEVLFMAFANKPYFFVATEYSNLQKLGYLREVDYRTPDAVIMTCVFNGDYNSLSLRGGDLGHMNKDLWEPYYTVQTLTPTRKPFHAGSAAISTMFPDHLLLGNKVDGGVVYSLPQGKFRFDKDKGAIGGQIAVEFVINIDKPEKAVAFTIEAVNHEAFLYDSKEAYEIEGYTGQMQEICQRYELGDCSRVFDSHDWDYKRNAYVITLVNDWYDSRENAVKSNVWSDAELALEDFYDHEVQIYNQLESTQPHVGTVIRQ